MIHTKSGQGLYLPPPLTSWTVEVPWTVVLVLKMMMREMTLYQVLAGLVGTAHSLSRRSLLDSCISCVDEGERDDIYQVLAGLLGTVHCLRSKSFLDSCIGN